MTIPASWRDVAVKDVQESIAVKKAVLEDPSILQYVLAMADAVCSALRLGNKVMFCGNGGSFADSQHLAAEFVSRFMMERAPLAAIALGTNNSILSAVGNDYSYNDVFTRELRAVGQKGDVLIAISTSGNSGNVLKVVEEAKKMGIYTFGLTGANGGKLAGLLPCLNVPSTVTARIQEVHITIGHVLCHLVDKMAVETL